jgi:maleamate amidohydrolase
VTGPLPRRAPWADVVPAAERRLHRQAGYGCRAVPGRHPALLVVDVTYEFTGEPGSDVPELLDRFPNACGAVAYDRLPRIRRLADHFRTAGLPVIYTTMTPARATWSHKNERVAELAQAPEWWAEVHRDIAPEPSDWAVVKASASPFHGTDLATRLAQHEIDTVVVTGCTTSGCVRATVVDAFALGLSVLVPHDAVFDRSPTPHAVTLFDIDMRYANVVDAEEVVSYLASCAAGRSHACPEWKVDDA